jgi:8-oxo-dGTP pyrophosphatase MutT (NUDIX family)
MIKSAFDKESDDEVIHEDQRSPRPKDAATLILIRRDAAKPRVLMGKRSGGHVFMPDKYVFPGGRVDPDDGRAVSWCELKPDVEAKLRISARRQPRAFAFTAIRETFEETGSSGGTSGRNASFRAERLGPVPRAGRRARTCPRSPLSAGRSRRPTGHAASMRASSWPTPKKP